MSTSWGYVCQSHNPPLESDLWIQGSADTGANVLTDLYRKERAGQWPSVSEDHPHYLAYGPDSPHWVLPVDGEAIPVPPHAGGGAPPYEGPISWLRQHPHCTIGLHNVYGHIVPIETDATLTP